MPETDRGESNLEEASLKTFRDGVARIRKTSEDLYSDFDKILPPLEDCVENFRFVYEWRIENWSNLLVNSSSVYSDTFKAGGYRWRILLFPNGNTTDKDVACFLDNQDSHEPSLDPNWHVCVQFSLVFQNIYGTHSLCNYNAKHRFTQSENDWGFNNIISISDLRARTGRSPGTDPVLLIDDSIIIRAYLRGYEDESGVLWHKFENWDSRKETGYVGLRNQGATCYMNSLLQSLYFTPRFCKSTFKIPTEVDKPCESVSLALQRLFYNLATSIDTVSTHELTKSFGWDANDSYLQHDVQEFNRVLLDNLENKMKGTVAEKAISRLFQGKMKSIVRCIEVQCESSRTEDFYDLQLNVKGCKNLHDSFMEYIKKETLEGDNKYYSSEHGLQDAIKGVIFEYFPPVLHLQLKRFEYDFNSNSMIKINDYYEFPLEFCVENYLEDSRKFNDDDLIYHLHGVLVHSGDLHCGHYCAFIRPGVENKWFKFDDERVSPASEREALNQNFGESPNTTADPSDGMNYNRFKGEFLYNKNHKKYTNAYMLVYLKDSERDDILSPLSIEKDIPEHLINSMNRENTQLENDKKEKIENSRFIDVRLLTDETIQKHSGHGLIFMRGELNESSSICFKFKRDDSVRSLREYISGKVGLDIDRFRLWVTSPRQATLGRPDTLITERHDRELLYQITESPKSFQRQKSLIFYLEKLPDVDTNDGEGLTTNHIRTVSDPQKDTHMILYLKYYKVPLNQVIYVGSAVVDRKSKVSDVTAILLDRLSLPNNTDITVYEEPKPLTADLSPLDQNAYLQKVGITSASILCFEDGAKFESLEDSGVYQYYESLLDFVSITLFPRKTNKLKNMKAICILADKCDRENDVIARIVNYPNFPVRDPLKIRLWINYQGAIPSRETHPADIFFPERFCGPSPLCKFIELTYRQSAFGQSATTPLVLEYDILDPSLGDISKKCVFTVSYIDRNMRRVGIYDLVVQPDERVQVLIREFLNNINVEEGGTELFRIVEFDRHKTIRAIHPNLPLFFVLNSSCLYIEELPQDELSIPIAHSLCVAKSSLPKNQKQIDAAMHERKLMRALSPDSNNSLSDEDPGNYDFLNPDTSKNFVINCLSFSKESAIPNGIPFRFVVFPGEVFYETKKRLRARMGFTDKFSPRIQYIITTLESSAVVTPQDDSVLSSLIKWTGCELLECDHASKVTRVSRYNSEKPVKING